MKKPLSNVLAIAGALLIVVGLGLLKLAAGIIVLGVFLLLGALATSDLRGEAPAANRAPNAKSAQ